MTKEILCGFGVDVDAVAGLTHPLISVGHKRIRQL